MIEVTVQSSFFSLDDDVENFIKKYELVLKRRKSYEEGYVDAKTFSIEEVKLWEVMQDFNNFGFVIDVWSGGIGFQQK